jgi:hypothetical protein
VSVRARRGSIGAVERKNCWGVNAREYNKVGLRTGIPAEAKVLPEARGTSRDRLAPASQGNLLAPAQQCGARIEMIEMIEIYGLH